MSDFVVEIRGATKRFPGVVALKDMQIQIRPGEVHGLIGENGAGKSTLIKYLTGVHKVDEGTMWFNGREVLFNNPNDAKAVGISCVYQELNIVKLLSITDNIFMGQCLKKKSGVLDYEAMHREAKLAMQILGQDVDVRKECGKFGMGIQQMVEIGKAVQQKAKLIIMDEPTSSLGEKEVEQLMQTIRTLKKNGVAILFVSHKLEELFEICDRVTVMRDGEYIMTEDIGNLTNDKLISAMVGRSLDNLFPKEFAKRGNVALEVKNLNSAGVVRDVSFKAYRGEVLGIAGLVGAGRTETFRLIFGADLKDSGEIYIDGKQVKINNPKDAIRHKLGLLTEDRKGQGLILSQTVRNNLMMANMKVYKKGIVLDDKAMEARSLENISELRIKTPDTATPVAQLSGGNQQKVVIGKWLNADIDIFVFDEPTRGIDVGAKIEVYNVMNQLVKQNKCVIMISSELPEVLGMSDRVLVMRNGRIMAEIGRDELHFNQESIMKAAWGESLNE